MKLLLDIVLTFMQIGILSFGGGYVAIPLVEHQVVEVKGWMSLSEFADVLAIDELTPGPIAVNVATFVGQRMAGVAGSIAATLGCILPSIILSLILLHFYRKYRQSGFIRAIMACLQAMVVALIASTALRMVMNALFKSGSLTVPLTQIDITALIIFAVFLFVKRKWKLDPLKIVIGSGLAGILLYYVF